ncbi:hypothetical protein [Prochlorococcus marinus]|uniref:hypothetical protein n=1 Tax=Prochlorococcus marinus TaxID=1219 RepID=UPI0022B56497|nr:hypothetical protein [Prochlorococcus marinus]
MNKILPIVFAHSFTTGPVLALSEGGCSLSNNKASQDETFEQVDSAYSAES